ncbi:efflux RND transporter permease subunit [Paraburkholderia caballeronis]|uniref:Multidrug efflux pump subunit AcrB n=1 Tax=Paraburkholderia caballeronis TaxID=416943 RepID=A0A1H7F4Y5_9BURK|nr:efflux RND transporter permease subunit [Paraburkholderia caballeronis]PXW14588.1 multidrug efflux pump subunit AcrB [Paraburkholderia caballeronis]PXW93333.1 multidrug efflux pump subunit AcrB [Paraburkholderia caballeronis]RAJ87237.1 multidrug efflux pump subunit AcrB [Paraburkholderia caballeronis]SEE81158.1 Multidrug efflux pump subunit AcrB [Paraburkholderia caballeronis]SEK18205.1 Multidrug efflux pump subunit AcrB [Paraburkholderia caballeronis]
MSFARALIERPLIAWVIALACLIGGLYAYVNIGRLEDPKFTIKTAIVVTRFPGASAEQVESQVTDLLESSIQQMEQVDFITSRSLPGYSEVRVNIRDRFRSPELPQIWDELRRQVSDVAPRLPAGAGPTIVVDRFGDVYGMFYALTGYGYTSAELHRYARELRRQLLTLPDVSDVVIAGNQQEQVRVDVDQAALAAANLSTDDIAQGLFLQGEMRAAGSVRADAANLRIAPTGLLDSLDGVRTLPVGNPGAPIQLGDLARVGYGYASIPTQLIRYNGEPALTIGISARANVNVVQVGREVKAKMLELTRDRPVGMELHVLYDQPETVDASVRGFIMDVFLSVAIVGIALGVGLGWRAGVVLGVELLLSILGTLALMYAFGIELQRISLGALIIVMGMLTDNTIVVCEGMLVRVERGESHVEAAGAVLRQQQWVLLASTVVGILAFSGIGLSPDAVGEFCASLFAVAAISLLLSWVIAVGLTPLAGYYLFRPKPQDAGAAYGSAIYVRYRRTLDWVIRRRVGAIAALVLLTVAGLWGFRFVGQSFFPASTTPIFYVDMRMPRGTDIRTVAERTRAVETLLLAQRGVDHVGTYIGGGATRFFLVYDPETPNPAYAQFIVTTHSAADIDPLVPPLVERLRREHPEALWSVSRPSFGPASGEPIQVRFSGPDPAVLRHLAEQTEAALRADREIDLVRDDWETPVDEVEPVFDDVRARNAGVTRRQFSDVLAYATEGLPVGVFREDDQIIPVVLGEPTAARGTDRLAGLQVFSATQRRYLPLADVIDGFAIRTDEGAIARRERIRTLTVRAGVEYGRNSVAVFERVRGAVEAIALPPGYRAEWGGEHESSAQAQASLFRQLPIGFTAMVLIVLFMFARVRSALVVLVVLPMAIIGVTFGLLVFRGEFGFMALLGLLSLVGMMIKNGVVLVQELDAQIAAGVPRMRAVVDGSMSRLRPVGLAAGTTILGMVPLLWDPFFRDMAITMMAGLAFATVLTMVAVPALYAQFFSIRDTESGDAAPAGDGRENR